MDTLNLQLKECAIKVLQNYMNFLGEDPATQLELIIDEKNDRYLLVELGWQNDRRIYGTILHLDIIGDKIWIQQDGTEEGIAIELVELGIPKHQIVLGFKCEERRRITDFAVC
jgi:XisI protein